MYHSVCLGEKYYGRLCSSTFLVTPSQLPAMCSWASSSIILLNNPDGFSSVNFFYELVLVSANKGPLPGTQRCAEVMTLYEVYYAPIIL